MDRLRASVGPPRRGVHAARLPHPLPDLAFWDVVLTVGLASVLARWMAWESALVLCVCVSLIAHAVCGVRTPLTVAWLTGRLDVLSARRRNSS